MAFPFLAAAVGAGALGSFFKKDNERQNFEFQKILQRLGFNNRLQLQQNQFGDNQISRDQQQGFFDTRRSDVNQLNLGLRNEADRLRGQLGTGGISQQEQNRLTQENQFFTNRNVGNLAGGFARRFGGGALNQPGIRAALINSQVGQQRRFAQGIGQESRNRSFNRDSQLLGLMTSLFGQQRTV